MGQLAVWDCVGFWVARGGQDRFAGGGQTSGTAAGHG